MAMVQICWMMWFLKVGCSQRICVSCHSAITRHSHTQQLCRHQSLILLHQPVSGTCWESYGPWQYCLSSWSRVMTKCRFPVTNSKHLDKWQKAFTSVVLRGCCCWRTPGSIHQGCGRETHLHPGVCWSPSTETEPSNTVTMPWPCLPAFLSIFHLFLVFWALQRSYNTQFQANLTGKGQRESYKIGLQVYDHSGDIHWLIQRWNSLSKVKGRKLQDATETSGIGKVTSSSNSESHGSGLQSPLSFPDIEQMPLPIETCLTAGWFRFFVWVFLKL